MLNDLPPSAPHGMIYMGDFNARHPDLGDVSPNPNRNGLPLLEYIRRHRLTYWPIGGATHIRGGTLDHIITSGLVASKVKCSSVTTLFSDHVAISLMYTLSNDRPSPLHTRLVQRMFPTFPILCQHLIYSPLKICTLQLLPQHMNFTHVSSHDPVFKVDIMHRLGL